jgi:uncharacterized protein (TIGR02265 family)
VAYRILGNRLGSAWVRKACERHPELREVMRPTVGPLSWYRIERLCTLLGQVPAGVRDPHRVARELGRAGMTSSFARFYGAEPETLISLTPAAVLADFPRFWPRFHAWGEVAVTTSPTEAVVTLTRTPRDPLVCCLVEGSLERIIELCGGIGARVQQTACESSGAGACSFRLSWSESGPLPDLARVS